MTCRNSRDSNFHFLPNISTVNEDYEALRSSDSLSILGFLFDLQFHLMAFFQTMICFQSYVSQESRVLDSRMKVPPHGDQVKSIMVLISESLGSKACWNSSGFRVEV